MDTFYPNYVETEIEHRQAFAFRLPAAAFGIPSEILAEICVEYAKDAYGALSANAWAGLSGGASREWMASVSIDASEDGADDDVAIMEALNQRQDFHERMHCFLHRLMNEPEE